MSAFHLIPYMVKSIVPTTKLVPPGIQLIEAPSLWEQGYYGEGVVIAVLDTGCDTDHPELKNQIIGGYNFTSDDKYDPEIFEDYNGHGTHVCGTICAEKNEAGIIGVAPFAKLLVIKVLSKQGYAKSSWITEGIKYAMNWVGPNGESVRIMNLSLGGQQPDPDMHEAIKQAIASNIIVVCASGNEGDGNEETNEYAFPGAFPEVVQVGSVNLQEKMSHFSNSNSELDLVAPGEDIISTYLHREFAVLSGTSMATPHVSGACALLIEKFEHEFERKITEPELYAQLIKRTISLNYRRTFQGNGILKLSSSLVKQSHENSYKLEV
nr:S8 family peptidase [Bacillus alkalicellulosilyticus]